jgi:hypothetical protein
MHTFDILFKKYSFSALEAKSANRTKKLKLNVKSNSNSKLQLYYRMNEEVGPIRAAAAQAEILRAVAWKVPQKMWEESVLSTLGASQTVKSLKMLHEVWHAEAQEAARDIIIDMHKAIALGFEGHDRTRFLMAVKMVQAREVP